jgi:hypothetical protein
VCKTLCDIVDKISERIQTDQSRTPYFNNYVTNFYKLSCFKSVTNRFFVLTSKVDGLNYSDLLKRLYETIYVELVCKNVLHDPEAIISLPLFRQRTREFFSGSLKGDQLRTSV